MRLTWAFSAPWPSARGSVDTGGSGTWHFTPCSYTCTKQTQTRKRTKMRTSRMMKRRASYR